MRTTRQLLLTLALVGASVPVAAQPWLEPASAAGAWAPPPCEGMFTDVPCTAQFADWVEQFARDGITSGCRVGEYCPDSPVTRRQMAVFVERAMRGTANWPPHTVLVHAVQSTDGSPNATASGQALLAGVAGIPTTGGGLPSATNPWTVVVGPGIFDLGTGSLALPAHVGLVGAGRESTLISSTGATVVALNESSGLRSVRVLNTSAGALTAVLINAGPARVEDVDVLVAAATDATGITATSSPDVELEGVRIYSTGVATMTGVALDGCSSFVLSNLTVGLAGAGTGSVTGVDLSSSSGRIERAFINLSVADTALSQGVQLSGGEVELVGCRINAPNRSDTATSAVSADDGGSVRVRDSYLASAQVGTLFGNGAAILLNNASADIDNVEAGGDWGLYASPTTMARTISVRGSILLANDMALEVEDSDYTTRLTHNDFSAGVTSAGTMTCLANTVGGVFYPSACP